MTGLYVHIPFCKKKCHYCNFVITGSGPLADRERFFSALEMEIVHYVPRFADVVFDTLYVGGGTPSTMTLEETVKFFGLIRKNFRVKPEAEITLEVNPGDVGAEKARLYRELGVNRVSLGAQSFNEVTLKRINRAHGPGEITESFAHLRKAGFQNINLDLILSLPDEGLEDVQYSLERLAALGPEHVSVYELTIEDKTVFGQEFKTGKLRLPPEEGQIQHLSFTQNFLQDKGFHRYELLNYAKPCFESRHNLLYWANENYLGLGPGAFSYFDGRRFRNSASFEEYVAKIEKDDWSAFEEETLTPEKMETESFLLALRLCDGADRGRFAPLLSRYNGTIEDLVDKGLLSQNEKTIRLTSQGQLLAETVFSELSLP
ncbi:MAG: radical SAM family heme chaperone HemW [Candidatus Omnitrophota bacterium]